MLAPRIAVWIVAAGLLWVASAPPHNDALAQRIAAEVARSPGAALDLDRVAPFAWDRVCTFPPYATWQGASATLGHPWPYRWSFELSHYEHLSYLVFLDGALVTQATNLQRTAGNFAPIGYACAERSDAILLVSEEPVMWPGETQVYSLQLGR